MNIYHEVSTSNEYTLFILISHVSTFLKYSLGRHYSSSHEVFRRLLLARKVYIEVRIEKSIRSIDRLIGVLNEGERRTISYDDIELFVDRGIRVPRFLDDFPDRKTVRLLYLILILWIIDDVTITVIDHLSDTFDDACKIISLNQVEFLSRFIWIVWLNSTIIERSKYGTEFVIPRLEESSAESEFVVPLSFMEILIPCSESVYFFNEFISLIARSCQDESSILMDVVVVILLLRNESSSVTAHRESFLESIGRPYRNELLLRV